MKRLFTIILFAVMLFPWTMRGQIMPDYTYRTGVDANKWITLDASATQFVGAGDDGYVSPITNIGFNFLFGEDYYTQFSVNTDGFMRLGPNAINDYYYYSSFYYGYFPKIAGVGKDLGTGTNGYVKYKTVGQAPNRVLVVEYKLGADWDSDLTADVMFQVQLHEDSNKVVIVYGSTAPSTNPASYQIGLGVSSTDFMLIDPTTHATTHHTTLTSGGTTSAWPGVNRYYEFLAPIITCPKPIDFALNSVTSDEAVVSWTETGDASQWIIEYGVAGFTRGSGTTDIVTDTFATLSSLAPNTTYDVYVRSICAVGDSSKWISTSFRTACAPYADTLLPYSESFDTWTTATIDPCFIKGNNFVGTSSYPSVSSLNTHTGAKCINVYSTEAYASWLILPEFVTPINQLQVSFWLRKTTDSYYPLIVGVTTDNMNSFDTIATVNCNVVSTWQQFVIPLGPYQGNGGRIALISPDGVYSDNYLDDITVELLPACPRPMNLTAMGTSTETAVIKWTGTGAAAFDVQYGITGFTLGSGTTEVAVEDSLEVFSLIPSSVYDVYVRSNCSGDTSEWIGPIQFRTACDALTDYDLPYFESFTSWVSTTNRDHCYTLANNYQGSLTQPSLATSPSKDSINSVYMYSGDTYASWMSLPAINTNIADLQVSFSMYKSSTYEYPLVVGVMTNPNDLSTFDSVAVVKCISENRWENFIIPLSSYIDEGQYITFLSPSGVPSGNYIDNITVDYLAACPNPINLSVRAIDHESAVVYFTTTSNLGSVVAEYGPTGFELGTGAQEVGSGDSIVITGLNPITTYDVYVYTDCGGEQSAVSDPLNFRTACPTEAMDVSVIPYSEDFNSYTTDLSASSTTPSAYPNHTLPSCWNFINMSSGSSTYPQVFLSQSSAYAVSGNCLFFRSSSTTPMYAVLPEFSSNIEDLRLRFTYRNEGTSTSNGILSIGVMTDPNNDSTFYLLETFDRSTDITDVEYIFSTDTITGTGYYIAFCYMGGSYNNYYLGIDNVIVDLAPECMSPFDIAASNIQISQADLSWVSENGTSFEIAYGPRGFSLDSVDDYTVEYSFDTTVTLVNLTANTYYDVYVRAYCSDFSEWSSVYTFKTACDVLSAPYSENFNSYSGNGVASSSSTPVGYPNNHTTPDCWSFNMSQSSSDGTRIFISSASGYVAGGSGKCLFFTGNSAGPGYAVLPQFSNSIDSLYIEFTYRYESASTGYGILGVMTDPTNDSTFIAVDTLPRTTTLTTIGHGFWDDGLTGTGYYIAVKWHHSTGSTEYYFSIDDVSVTAPTCRPTTNIMATNITSNSADITWNNITADSYVVAYSTTPNFDPTTCTTTISTTTTTATITGLSTYTQYYYSVKTMCGSEDLGWSDIYSFFTTASCSGNLVQVDPIIGTESSTTSYLPLYAYSGNTYPEATTWQIYTSEDLERAGAYSGYINSVSFQYTSAAPLTSTFKVYMAQTTANAFASFADTIPLSQMTLVFDGSKEFNQNDEWTTIILNTPFQYSDTSNLVVAVARTTSVTTTGYSGYFKYSTTPGANTAAYRYKYVDSYYGDEYYSGYTATNRNNIMFNMCTDVPPCTRPRDVVVSNVQTTQADVSYKSSASSFEIAYGPAGFDLDAVGTYQVMQVVDTFATITNLTPGTRYDVYVRAICSANEISNWSFAIRSFFTSCVSQGLPYAENFDSYTTDVVSSSSVPATYPDHIMPNCWNFTNMSGNSSSYPQAFVSSYSGYPVTGNCLFLKSSASTPIYSVLPKFDASIDSLYIEFAYRNESTYSGNGPLTLGVMTDPSNPATFVALESYPINSTISRIEHYFSLDSVQGNNYYIAFRYQGTSDNYYLGIDEIFVDYAPSCFKPQNLMATNATSTTIDLIWTDRNDAGDYVVEYKKSIETAWTAVYGITDTFTTVTNLSPSSGYEFRVKAICGIGDSSYYCSPITARTLCGPVQLPFGEDFAAGGFLYECWEKLTGIPFSASAPTSTTSGFGRTSSNNGLTGPHVSVNIYGTYTKYWLVTPEIDLTNVSSSQLTFDLALTAYNNSNPIDTTVSTYDDKFMVIVSTDTGHTWLPENATIWSDDTVNVADYSFRGIATTGQQVTIDLSQYAGNIIKVAFYAESTVTNGDNDLHIDNILISAGAGCPAPTMTVTPDATTATLTWTSTTTDFEIEYKEASASEWSQTIAVSNTTSYTITGLVPETSYMVRIRTICEEGEYSAWVTTTITTLELPCLAPTAITANNVAFTSATIAWTDATNNQEAWAVAYGYGNDASAWDTIMVTAATANLTGLYANTQYTVYVKGYCSVASDVYSDWSEPFTFSTAACAVPTNVTVTDITASSATISWTPASGQTKWEISYGMEGVNEENGTKVVVEGTPSYSIQGLDYEMTYDVYVRAICAEGVYSAWTSKTQFTTDRIGINTASNDNVSVRIYPNPANTEATITVEGISGKVEFVVADMNGRMIVTETIACEGSLEKSIDVSNLAKGAYFVHIYNDNFNTTRKLIVK